MNKISKRTNQQWIDAIKQSINKKKEAIAAAQIQLRNERIASL